MFFSDKMGGQTCHSSCDKNLGLRLLPVHGAFWHILKAFSKAEQQKKTGTQWKILTSWKKFTSEERKIPIRVSGGCLLVITRWQIQLICDNDVSREVITATDSHDNKVKPKLMSNWVVLLHFQPSHMIKTLSV